MANAIGRSWRTWAYGLFTYIGSERLARLGRARAGRLLLAALQHLVSGGSVRVAGGAGGHLRLCTDLLPIDHQQGYGLVRGVLEPGVQEALRRHVRPGAVVYDVGANIGLFTLLSARFAGPAGRVEAFEPVAASAAAIRANVALNGFEPTVGIHNVAVGEQGGTGELLITGEESWSHLADRGWHSQTLSQVSVSVVALDEMIAEGSIVAPDVVKIDVEGSEVAVLRGLRRTLGERDVVVICELHETNAEVVELFDELGYSVENLDGTAPVASAGPIHVLARRWIGVDRPST